MHDTRLGERKPGAHMLTFAIMPLSSRESAQKG